MPMACDQNEPESTKMVFPYFASGEVVKGFGRGSKELGIPTANFPESVVDVLPEVFHNGVYYGWAQVENGPVYKMVMSIGNNPYYNNQKRTMETYVMNEFEQDFYGSNLKIVMLGYIRPMTSFNSLDELIKAIKKDISDADKELENIEKIAYKNHNFFKKTNNKL